MTAFSVVQSIEGPLYDGNSTKASGGGKEEPGVILGLKRATM